MQAQQYHTDNLQDQKCLVNTVLGTGVVESTQSPVLRPPSYSTITARVGGSQVQEQPAAAVWNKRPLKMTRRLVSPQSHMMETYYSYLIMQGKSNPRRQEILGNTQIIHRIKKKFCCDSHSGKKTLTYVQFNT